MGTRMKDEIPPLRSGNGGRGSSNESLRIGAIVHRLDVCSSTSDVARDLAEAGGAHGTAVVAEEQTAGRGTKGRCWYSPRGCGLYVSFVLRPAETGLSSRALSLLPLASGLAGADCIREVTGLSAVLKWPNDLVWGRLKFGGILAESVFRAGAAVFSIVGVGINIGQEETDFPDDLRFLATSLKLIVGRTLDKELLFSRLCRALESWYNALREGRTGDVVRAYERNMAFRAEARILVTTSGDRLPGRFAGLGSDGRLRLENGGRVQEIRFDDIRALDWD